MSVGEDVMDDDTVLTLSVGFAVFFMLMLFQIPLNVRRAWRSLMRSSLGRIGCGRRTWKARLAEGRQDRHGILPDGEVIVEGPLVANALASRYRCCGW